jgi:hypothetical protein
MPDKIIIIRHGEKPPPLGVTIEGDPDAKSLSVRGWVRAGALVAYFAPPGGAPAAAAVPDVIYASSPAGPSRRPLQTVAPLAEKLGLQPKTRLTKGDEKALAAAVLAEGGTVLICWQHEQIPDIVRHLTSGASSPLEVPRDWPDDRFDVVWVLTRTAEPGEPWRFSQVPQRLLAGDRAEPIA